MELQRVAFFDIDGTVFRSSLLIELVEELIRAGIFPTSAHDEYRREHERWLARDGSYEAYIEGVIRAFGEHIRGTPYGAVADLGKEIVERRGRHVYRYTRDLIRDLKAQGVYVVAISQSPKFMLDAFCEEYGFDKVYGRIYELGPQDRFTGAVVDLPLIAHKANIVDRVIAHTGFSLSGSIGVGDTDGDISLLERVEVPICFNPNRALYEHARAKRWTIVIERKDVVYTLAEGDYEA